MYRLFLKKPQVSSQLQRLRFSATVQDQASEAYSENSNSHYQHAHTGDFAQEKPILFNPYTNDGMLKSYLQRNIPQEYFQAIDEDLHRFGDAIVSEIDALGDQCELLPPTLTHYDAWGKRIDKVNTCAAWNTMKRIAAKEGLIAHGYKRKYGQWSRMYQMAKLYLFGPSSGLYSCPLAMADGAAKVLESALKDTSFENQFLRNPFERLVSMDPDVFWTSGQWMTEKGGGSDVASATDTLAYEQTDGTYKLYGYKWFTSATDADMTLTLARITDQSGNFIPGSKGLSLFYLETHSLDPEGKSSLNQIQITRLKDKLGTRQLPTGELILDGTVARLVGAPSSGVRSISGMLTLTRIHNSLMSVGGMRHLLLLSKDYLNKRKVFGSLLQDNSLHMQTMARMELECRAGFLFAFEVIRLLGLDESKEGGPTEDEKNLLRLLTPVCKLYTAKQAVSVSSEGLESFGGAGYLEDTGLPRHLRDAQVLSIWEGTTNVLSMDTLRAIAKSRGQVLNSYFISINDRLSKVSDKGKKGLRSSVAKVHIAAGDLRAFISQSSTMGSDTMFLAARDFSYSLARIYMAMLLLEHAAWHGATEADVHAATLWCAQDLCPVTSGLRSGFYSENSSLLDRALVFDSFKK
ncbi:acyl-CoA dehydrogenase family member 11-like [Clavelina lepadiformis]|uniref:Acyl-CoA dehydrogenase n=1 Tax=Clavelina lepadiformis TaxID=159417 RepID=A0ABP0GLC5_CLALP